MKCNTDSFVKEINHELISCNCQLVSALIIYPKDFTHQKLIRNVILREDIQIDTFKTFESRFVNDPKNPRTLTFEKYRESVKYSSLSKGSKTNNSISNPSYPIYILDEFEIKPPANDLNKQKRFWRIFIQELKNSISQAYSTLWSYIVLKKVNETNGSVSEVVCSAYLTFSGDIGKKSSIIIDKICQDYLYVFVNDHYNKELKSQATRAAISQVMARNTSHNIGAHVMNKLIDSSSLEKFDVLNCTNYRGSSTLSIDDQKIFQQIALFNNYVKCRMDYLADISFGTPLMQTNKYAYAELFTELDKVRLLLEHISGLSAFEYKVEFKRNGKYFKANSGDQEDLLVAIPNDILGTQAFYNILENIIRNTAKHSSNKPNTTIFTVNFIDDIKEAGLENAANKKEIENTLNEFIAVEVYDNIPLDKAAKHTFKDDNAKKTYCRDLRIEESKTPSEIPKIDWLIYNQNKKLNEDILQEENKQLRSSSLGLVEMDASAAYLRKRPVEFINHQSYDIQYDESWSRNSELNKSNEQKLRGTNCRHFLKAFKTKEEFEITKNNKTIKGNALGYRFFLHRPAVVLVVTEELKDNTRKKDTLKKEGIWVVDKAEFEVDLKAGKVYPHEFVVYTDLVVENTTINKYKTSLPIRIINTITNLSDLLNESAVEIEKKCWEKWETEKYHTSIDVVNSFDNECQAFQAVFLDHLYSANGTAESGKGKQEWESNKDANYVEALSSLAQSKMPDFNKTTHENCDHKNTSVAKFKCYIGKLNDNEFIKRKIKEAVLTKVIVIDERIQNTTKEPDEGGRDFMSIPYNSLYAKIGLIVPDKSLNLSESSFETITKSVEEYIKQQIKESKSTDFILIHYSILERMYKKEEIKTHLGEWAKSINVVVTSGRGTPDNLSENVRFANLSSVITAFVEVRSKYAINYLLNSSRKSNKI